ncbi:MAG: RNA polymerase subunit sigma-70, partial [Ignavibacteriae bacterium]|nr:RNA polymerase subunit sigma-70 [Ignavibacteriota bacterium]
IEGFKYSEIAEICEISIKAVEKRMTKTLKILRKSLS